MALSSYLANRVLDHLVGKTAFTMPTVFVALSSTTPNAAGTNVTEPSGGGYARVATSGATWAAATAAANTNASAVTFPQASADWLAGANLTYVCYFDSATVGAGNLLDFYPLTTPKNALSGDTINFPAGELDRSIA